jgi:hypothetical protein
MLPQTLERLTGWNGPKLNDHASSRVAHGHHLARDAPRQPYLRLIAQDDHQPHLGALEHRIDQAAVKERDGVGVGQPWVGPRGQR